jgi:hypothetical protein
VLNWLFLQNLATLVHATAGVGLDVIRGANARVVDAFATTDAADVFNCCSERITEFSTNGYLYCAQSPERIILEYASIFVIDSR